jgi:hypothetical protein
VDWGDRVPVARMSLKLGLLVLPLMAWQVVELFVLPSDAFAFRFWEGMVTRQVYLLPGPFYPNRRLDKWTAGDQQPRAPRRKFVRFQSDEFGQRNAPGRGDQYDVVVIGDSNVVGSHIDEPDTIRAALERECNCRVYAYGPYLPVNILSFLSDRRFERNPPKWVVLEFRPGDIEARNLPIYDGCRQPQYPEGSLVGRFCPMHVLPTGTQPLVQILDWLGVGGRHEVLVLVDRIMKQSAYHAVHARLRLVGPGRPSANPEATAAEVSYAIEAFRSYQAALAARGTRLLLFSMHNQKPGPASVSPWNDELRDAGLRLVSIDTTTTPPELFSRWWLEDDSHWREESIAFSAALMWRAIGE